MPGAQANEPRQGGERYWLRKMFFDIACDDSLLPCGEPALRARSDGRNVASGVSKLIHKHDAERLEIAQIRVSSIVEQELQPHRPVPKPHIVEQHPRTPRRNAGLRVRGGRKQRRIKIEEHETYIAVWLAFFAILVLGRHKRQLASQIPEARRGHAIDESLTAPPLTLLIGDEQMLRGVK